MKKSVIIALILFFSSIFTLIFLLFIKDDVKVSLIGNREVHSEVYEDYKEAGIKVINRGKEISKKDYKLTRLEERLNKYERERNERDSEVSV